jgi:hypothetical protein
MTVVGFAEHLGVSARTVSNWESRGADIEPLPEMQAALDTALGRADPATRERFDAVLTRVLAGSQQTRARSVRPPAQPPPRETSLVRETLLEWAPSEGQQQTRVLSAVQVMTAAGQWLAGKAEPLQNRSSGLDAAGIEISPGLLDTLEARVHQLRRVDDQQGGIVVLRLADHDLSWTLNLLGSAALPPEPARRLHAVIAELAQLAGWLACDLGQVGDAQNYWMRGLRAASAADDSRLGAYIVSCLSYQALWYGQGQEALALAGIAREGFRGPTSGAVDALLWTRQARASALLRDRAGCELALDRAAGSLALTVPADDPPWIYWVTRAVLAADAGRARLDLGLLEPAEEGLSLGLDLLGSEQPRNRLLHLASLAEARLLRGEIDSAAGAAIDSADLAIPMQSGRGRQRLRNLHAAFGREHTGSAREARERLESVLVG